MPSGFRLAVSSARPASLVAAPAALVPACSSWSSPTPGPPPGSPRVESVQKTSARARGTLRPDGSLDATRVTLKKDN